MKKLLLLSALALATLAGAQTSEPKINVAFSQLKGNGVTTFADTIYGIGSASSRQLATQMGPMISDAGDYLGYQLVQRTNLAKNINRLILVIYFDRFPVYLRIDTYDTPAGRIYLPANVSKDPDAVLPFDIISAAGK
ncbi:MAG TPA: hypothetical protein VHD32_01835 [Candidatus Didemnitutus sp.]|nr:hypothetical protein [Candidatus Didemnitutus sp.]